MNKEQTIERITSYLPHLRENVLASVLTLLENTEFEDDAWDLQMEADNQAGRLDKWVEEAKQGEATDMFEGFKEHSKAVT